MSTGISIGGQTTGGSSVGSSNPLPVYTPSGYGFQLTDGTRFVDVVSGGTAEATWNEGVMFMGKDTAGTAYPIPLSAGGGGVPVTGTQLDALTDAELRANNLATEGKQDSIITAISGVLTDAQLSANNLATEGKQDSIITAIGGVLTDAELRATSVPVSVASLPAGTNLIGKVNISPPLGTGTNATRTLTLSATAYTVIASTPITAYQLVMYNNSDTDIYWGFANSNANGILLPRDGRVALDMGASQAIYAYCASAGKTLATTYKLLS